ncbi:nucleoside phosphorylase [Candidatus Woesearchaeota archaeon]|jgi:uridine phosphorylase|nr:nucleoside phosphorylase [Candidatus Woesearchaeota archaeon]
MAKAIRDSELIVLDGRVYHLGLKQDQLAKQIFVVGDPDRADLVAAKFDTVEHSENNREYVTRTGTHNGMHVSVVATGIGTDNNEIAMVEMYTLNEFNLETKVRNKGAKPLTIIRLGTSGGPQEDIELGTLAISTHGLGLDNTGSYYEAPHADFDTSQIEKLAYKIIDGGIRKQSRFKGKIIPYASKASPEVVDALISSAELLDVPHAVGITASSSGFYGPQGREIHGLPITVPGLQERLATLQYNEHRVVNFEMESSLLFHMGQAMGYRTGTICAIIANRPRGTFMDDYSPAVDQAIDIGLKAMHKLYKTSK